MTATSFGYFKPEFTVALGSLAKDINERPSTLLTWTEEEDWISRLIFDFHIMNEYHKAEQKAQKKALRGGKSGR